MQNAKYAVSTSSGHREMGLARTRTYRHGIDGIDRNRVNGNEQVCVGVVE